jgi:hypothetical protein
MTQSKGELADESGWAQRFEDLPERLRSYIDRTDGCWVWIGRRTGWGREQGAGYGRYRMEGRELMAHRVVYEALIGPIPRGLVLDHLCRNTRCVNPEHLDPVTQKVNVERSNAGRPGVKRKTHCPKGHKYTPENTYLKKGRWQQCRICHSDRERVPNLLRYYAKIAQRGAPSSP